MAVFSREAEVGRKEITGRIVNPASGEIRSGRIVFEDGRILEMLADEDVPERYIVPGFVDSHIHIESSMLMPSRFAAAALRHGTLAAVCDPHEIANVLGLEGVRGFLADAENAPFSFVFGAPSCVPATSLETSGAALTACDIKTLFSEDGLRFLGEVMNVPCSGREKELEAKLDLAKEYGLPIDGHAPGLLGADLRSYVAAGMTTDHECSTVAEAMEKVRQGMFVQIRDGSAARNFDDLLPLFFQVPGRLMLASDDKHPDDLLGGHINRMVSRALKAGVPFGAVLRAACINPVMHYRIPLGLLRPGDSADWIVVEAPLEDMRVTESWYRGECAMRDGVYLGDLPPILVQNRFARVSVAAERILPEASRSAGKESRARVRVIEVEDGQLLTGEGEDVLSVVSDQIQSDTEKDILVLSVVNRYQDTAHPASAFIRGFGLKGGALASSVAHDSHNIIAVGTSADLVARAIMRVGSSHGGIVALSEDGREEFLPLPYGGIVSTETCLKVSEQYRACDVFAREILGSKLRAPFMTLSFMALLVIPRLKLGDRGLFDGEEFVFVPVQKEIWQLESGGVSEPGQFIR